MGQGSGVRSGDEVNLAARARPERELDELDRAKSAPAEDGSAKPSPLEALVERAQAGEVGALDALLEQLRPRLRRFGQRLCGQAGEDALQEALLALASQLASFRGESDVYSWAFALVRSACARQTRGLANAPKEALSAEVVERGPGSSEGRGPEAQLMARQRSEELNCALASLEGDLRAAVVLRDIEELRAAEAAAVLGISVAALKSRLHRGRRALAEALLDPSRAVRGCPDVIGSLSAQLEGDLDDERCADLRKHLDGCADCARRCLEFRKVIEGARLLPEQATPELSAQKGKG